MGGTAGSRDLQLEVSRAKPRRLGLQDALQPTHAA